MRSPFESLFAAAVLLVAFLFLGVAVAQRGGVSGETYQIEVHFQNVSGLETGSIVRIAGVGVGAISDMAMDPLTFDVKLTLDIARGVAIDSGAIARISSDGPLGDSIVAIQRGESEEMLDHGDRLTRSESPVNIVDQFGRFIFGGTAGGGIDDF